MPLTRKQKEERVQKTEADLSSATSLVFLSFNALNVDDAEELRDQLHAQGARLRVLPKKLFRLILQKLNLSFDPTVQEGQVAVVWGNDAVAPAKTLHQFSKKHEQIKLLAGSLEGQLLSLEQVSALAVLPSREQLLAKLVGTINNPVRGLVTVFSGVQRQTVQVLKAIADKKSV